VWARVGHHASVLVLSRREVEELLDLDALVEALADAMADLSAGRASMPSRNAAFVRDHDAMLASMPAFLPTRQALMTKMVSLFPHNRDRPTHQAVICCFEPNDGTPIALIDGTYVTEARTAAGSVLASRYLARGDAHVLSIIGTGVQGCAHARAFRRRPGIDIMLIAGRDAAKAKALAERVLAGGMRAEAAESIEEAVRAADIVCACTHADVPVVRRSWLRPGTHVNSVGYNRTGQGEVDAEVIRDAMVVVESREAVLAPPPSGAVELHRAIGGGVVAANHIHAEVGEIVSGAAGGRADTEDITLYKSVGVAVQDAAAAALILGEATRTETGTHIDV
jgi:alanine dehydrogenase